MARLGLLLRCRVVHVSAPNSSPTHTIARLLPLLGQVPVLSKEEHVSIRPSANVAATRLDQMLQLIVPRQIAVQLEHPRAYVAFEIGVHRVLPDLMTLHAWHSLRPEIALRALEHLVALLVQLHVKVQRPLRFQELMAHRTLDPCVTVSRQMSLQFVLPSKDPGTVVAAVGRLLVTGGRCWNASGTVGTLLEPL